MEMRRTVCAVGSVVALALAAGGTIAGCGSSSDGVTASAVNRSVTIRVSADYDTLDPYKANSSATAALNAATYDELVYADEKGHIRPYLATSWKVTPTSVVLHVKQNVKCADGSALTPADMAASLQRFVSPKTKAPSLSQFLGDGPFTVTSSGDTVTLRTKSPSATLLTALSQLPIICPAGLRNPASLRDKPAGSGPYTLTQAHRGNAYTFTRRNDWTWGPEDASGRPKTLVYRVIANDSTAANLLSAGDLDIAQVSGPDTKRLTADSSLVLHPFRDYGMTFMQFNEAPGRVTDDIAVRRALAQAIDRDAWNKAFSNGEGFPSPSIFPTNLECYDPGTASVDPPFDAAAAKAGLERAGYTAAADGTLTKDGKPLAIKVIAWEGSQLGPDYVAAALQKVGIKATLQKTDISTYIEAAQKGDFDVSILPSEMPAPLQRVNPSYLTGPGGKDGVNWALTKNPTADHWMSVAGASVGTTMCAAWSKVQRAYAEQVDIKPLASEAFTWFAPKGLAFTAIGPNLVAWSVKAG